MLVPKEFDRLVECFYQGSDEEVSTIEEWIVFALEYLNKQQRAVVKRFLQELLAQNLTDAQLQRIWGDAGANYDFDDIRGVLTLIRDAID
jgi:hypothetical protein